MMYQFFAPDGAPSSAAAVAEGASAGCSSPEASRGSGGFWAAGSAAGSSSFCCISSGSISRLLRKEVQNRFDGTPQQGIDYREVSCKREYGEDHHRGRALHLLAIRPGHPPHLKLQIVDVFLRVVRPNFDIGHKRSFVTARTPNLFAGIGRGGGIRTPTRGFGDRWSAVKPTPLGPHIPLAGCEPRILLAGASNSP